MKTCKKASCLLLSLLLLLLGSMSVCAADGDVSVRVTNSETDVTVGYRETKCFEFETTALPDGASVYVFLNGEQLREDTYVCVSDPTEDYTVEARVLDAQGAVIASSGVIHVTVKNGVFDRLLALFKNTVGTAADAVADVLSAIFMRIVVFLNGGSFLTSTI